MHRLRQFAPHPPERLAAEAQLTHEQMLVNQALVDKILQCEQAEAQLLRLMAHQLQLREDERKRISREIHDSLGQNLLALRLDVESMYADAVERDPELQPRASSALANLDGTVATVRALIADLRPFQIELGLEAAVEWELSKFKRRSGLATHLQVDAAFAQQSMSDLSTTTAYRILQECLDNILQHAKAGQVLVELSCAHGMLCMRVSDNGIGFDPQAVRPNAYGLLGMRERMHLVHGELDVESSAGHGATVSISLPVS